MASEFDSYAEAFAVPQLMDQFGERDAIQYRRPGEEEWHDLERPILGNEGAREEDLTRGGAVKRSENEITVRRGNAKGQLKWKPEISATIKIGNEVWSVDEIISLTPSMATLRITLQQILRDQAPNLERQ